MYSSAPQASSSYSSSSSIPAAAETAGPAQYTYTAAQPNASAFHVFQAVPPSDLSSGVSDGNAGNLFGNVKVAPAATTTSSARATPAATDVSTQANVISNGAVGDSANASAKTDGSGSVGRVEDQQQQHSEAQTQPQAQESRQTTTFTPQAAAEEAWRRGKHKGRRAEEVDAMTQTASRCVCSLTSGTSLCAVG